MFSWNEKLTLKAGVYYQCILGSLELIICRDAGEWHFHHRYTSSSEENVADKIVFKELKKLPSQEFEYTRVMGAEDQDHLLFKPRLADRAIVAKPHQPLMLPCNQEATVYISTPVWLSVWQENEKAPLFDIATYKLSDTWYGPKPHLGILCYASRFSGRTQLKNLPRRVSRIITPVTIVNRSDEHLKIEKIAIPAEILSVYGAEMDLWTHGIKVIKHKDEKLTTVEVEKKLHESLTNMQHLVEPRARDTDNLISKTFARIFS